jgi:hypothetical protein
MIIRNFTVAVFSLLASNAATYAASPDVLSVDPSYQHVTQDFKDVFTTAQKLGKKCRPDRVVIALDLDNTIMANDQPLGSEQWFDWQSSLLTKKTPDPSDSQQLVGKDFQGLLQANSQILKTMTMHPTEPTLPQMLDRLASEHYKILVLTSRGSGDLPATEQELQRNGFHFEHSTLSPAPDGLFLPYNPKRVTDAGFSNSESKTLQSLGKPWPVVFKDGLYLTSGQNKGYMLRALLQKTGTDACAVVFADNKEVYSQQMQAAFKNQNAYVATFRYSREDDHMDEFKNGDKTPVTQAWGRLKSKLMMDSMPDLPALAAPSVKGAAATQ